MPKYFIMSELGAKIRVFLRGVSWAALFLSIILIYHSVFKSDFPLDVSLSFFVSSLTACALLELKIFNQ